MKPEKRQQYDWLRKEMRAIDAKLQVVKGTLQCESPSSVELFLHDEQRESPSALENTSPNEPERPKIRPPPRSPARPPASDPVPLAPKELLPLREKQEGADSVLRDSDGCAEFTWGPQGLQPVRPDFVLPGRTLVPTDAPPHFGAETDSDAMSAEYSFGDPPSDEEMKTHLRQSLKAERGDATWAEMLCARPSIKLGSSFDSSSDDDDDYLPGHLVGGVGAGLTLESPSLRF